MKLFELVTIPTAQNKTHASVYLNPEQSKLPAGIKVLGKGVEGVVFKNDGEPGVIKVMTTASHVLATSNTDPKSLGSNPYVKYVYISQRYAKGNPFLPRVYQISKQTVSQAEWESMVPTTGDYSVPDTVGMRDGRNLKHPPFLLSFRMEKLFPVSRLNMMQLAALYHKAFGVEYVPQHIRDREIEQADTDDDSYTDEFGGFDDDDDDDDEYSPHENGDYFTDEKEAILSMIEQHLTGAAQYGVVLPTMNAQLLQAVKLINSIKHKTQSTIDIHSHNFMARMTVGGPQLVITDPLVFFAPEA